MMLPVYEKSLADAVSTRLLGDAQHERTHFLFKSKEFRASVACTGKSTRYHVHAFADDLEGVLFCSPFEIDAFAFEGEWRRIERRPYECFTKLFREPVVCYNKRTQYIHLRTFDWSILYLK